MYNTAKSFMGDIKALKGYVESVGPVLEKKNYDKVEENLDKIYNLYNTLDEQGLIEKDETADEVEIDNISNKKRKKIRGKIKSKISGKDVNLIRRGVLGLKKDFEDMTYFMQQEEILYRGSLVSLIIYFESLIARLLHNDFIKHPQRMGLENKTVTYSQLINLKDFAEVKEHLVQEEIVKMMYKDSNEWFNFFRKNLKVKLKYINEIEDELNEIFARRNLFVHNDGKVNSFYLSKVSDAVKEKVNRDDNLTVNREYINRAVEIVENVGIILVLELWINEKGKEQEEIDKMFDVITTEYLLNERWEISIELYNVFLDNKKIDKQHELLSRLNRWQCYKWLERYDEVKVEIEKEDFSAYSCEFQLGRLALMDKIEEFFILYDAQSIVTPDNLREWPIFKTIRESDEYKSRFNKDKIDKNVIEAKEIIDEAAIAIIDK